MHTSGVEFLSTHHRKKNPSIILETRVGVLDLTYLHLLGSRCLQVRPTPENEKIK